MKAKIFAAIFFLILSFFAYKVFAQDAGLTSIMSQNKIRTCLGADPMIRKRTSKKGDDLGGEGSGPESVSKMRLTGTCEAPKGCEIWYEGKTRSVTEGKVKYGKAEFRKVVNRVA